MKELTDLFKTDKLITSGLFLSALFYFFIFQNKLFSLLACLMSIILSLILLKRTYALKKNKEDKLASLSFLYSFIYNLEDNKGTKESYESASKYLVGHSEIKAYDDFIASGIKLSSTEENQKLLDYLVEKERNNEIHLLNYHETLLNLENDNGVLKARMTKASAITHKAELALIFMLLILTLIINLSNTILATLNNMVYNILALIASSLFFPAILLDYYLRLKGM